MILITFFIIIDEWDFEYKNITSLLSSSNSINGNAAKRVAHNVLLKINDGFTVE